MNGYSSREAARRLGISFTSLNRYIAAKKIPVPEVQEFGGGQLRIWTEQDIEKVRTLLPKIANGRKTRYQKQKPEVRSRKSAKAKSKTRTQPRAAALQKKKEKSPPKATVPDKQHKKK